VPDILVKIYLYFLVFNSLLFGLVHWGVWLAQRERPRRILVRPKLLWRNLFFLISGLVAWYLFYSRLLSNLLVLVCALLMLIAGAFAAEVLERKRVTAKPDK
jgi:hypothetical protein